MTALTPSAIITAYSIELVFLGMLCVLYGFCAYTLWGQKYLSCRMLLIINTMQFLLCVAQIVLQSIFHFIVFIFATGHILPYLQHVNGYLLGCVVMYNINFAIGGFLSMWRLYVLFDSNLWVCLPAFVFWIGQLCMSGMIIHTCATVPAIVPGSYVVHMLLWSLITALYLCVAIPICHRLCMAQKRTHTILSNSLYKSIAIIVVECGALITLCSVAMLILYGCNPAYATRGIGTAVQVAVMSQLLITARHAMLSQHHDVANPPPAAFEINVTPTPTESSHVDAPITPVKTNSHSGAESGGQEKLAL